MAGCGCVGTCDCFIEGAGLVSVTGTGDVTDPYVVTGTQSDFDLTSLSQALVVTPGGPQGHTPDIDLVIDPAGTAPVTVGPAGLKVDCCDPEAAAISAEVCNDLYDNAGLYADGGKTILDPGAASTVGIPGVADTDSSVSWARNITNNEDCDVLVTVVGEPRMTVIANSGATNTEIVASARIDIASAHTFVGGSTQRVTRFVWASPAGLISASDGFIFVAYLAGRVIVPAGDTLALESVFSYSKRANLTAGSNYIFGLPELYAERIRRQDIDVIGAAP